MPPIADDELIKMLDRLLAESSRRDEADAPNPIPAAFIDMRNRAANGVGLSPKQTAWIRGIYDRVFDEPTYENLVSAGKVPSVPHTKDIELTTRRLILSRTVLAPSSAFVRALAAEGIAIEHAPATAGLSNRISERQPDLVLIDQNTEHAIAACEAVRWYGPVHAQAIVLLDHLGPAPNELLAVSDGTIWRDVGIPRLVEYIIVALRRRASLARMRAVAVTKLAR